MRTPDLSPRGTQVMVTLSRRLTNPPSLPRSRLQRVTPLLALPIVAIALVLIASLLLLALVWSLAVTALLGMTALIMRRR